MKTIRVKQETLEKLHEIKKRKMLHSLSEVIEYLLKGKNK